MEPWSLWRRSWKKTAEEFKAKQIAEEEARAAAEEVLSPREVARLGEESRRLGGYFSRRGEKREAMSLEEREVAVAGREAMLDEKQAEVEARNIEQSALDARGKEVSEKEAEAAGLVFAACKEDWLLKSAPVVHVWTDCMESRQTYEKR